MASTNGTVSVLVPFSVTVIRQCKEKLGSFSEDSEKYADSFHTLKMAFDLTWQDVPFIIISCSTAIKRQRSIKAAKQTNHEAFGASPSDNQLTAALFGSQVGLE